MPSVIPFWHKQTRYKTQGHNKICSQGQSSFDKYSIMQMCYQLIVQAHDQDAKGYCQTWMAGAADRLQVKVKTITECEI